uniref:Uncharacterized protein n=1 Tax=Anguilla anguilla TaxID=7936 RepID=A0A0E9RAP1_ANGAN
MPESKPTKQCYKTNFSVVATSSLL